MTFREDAIDSFKALFQEHKEAIANQPGCEKLSLLQDVNNPAIFMTYSWWNSTDELNNYRHSETFGIVWPATKKLFAEKPEAWSVNEVVQVK